MSAKTADVIVIGGGITGTSTAYQLAKRGHSVILLEKTHLGAGSTGRTGGIIRQHYSNEVTCRMALRSLKVWQDFDNAVGGEVGWFNTGVLFVVGPDHAQGMKSNIELQRSVGIRVELLDADGVREVAPWLAVDDIGAGAWEPDSGVADGAMAATAFAKRAREFGATLKTGVEVTAITVASGRVTGVETTDGVYSAPVVVNAAGPWAAKLALGAGYETPAQASAHSIAVFQQPENAGIPDHHAAVADFIQGSYVRSDTGHLTLGGSIEPEEAEDNPVPDPDNYGQTVTMDFNLKTAERTQHRMPAMRDARVGRGWVGLYTVTPDWHPIIGPMPGLEGFISAFGFSGSGFKMGPVVGEMVADLAANEQLCPIDSSLFRFERFAEDRLIRGQYAYSILG